MIAEGAAITNRHQQTEIGPIPDDWRLEPLGRLISSAEYGSSAKSNSIGKIPVLRMGNLQDGKIDWDDLVYTDDEAEIRNYQLCPRDVLFNRTNTVGLVGKCAIYKGERSAIFAGYLIRIIVDESVLDARFLNYVLNTELARKHSAKVLSVAVGQANINAQKLRTYPIPLPPTLAEQEAIAEALGDADAWIESLERLVAKKRSLKQAATQQLLTGKKRLPGFEQSPMTEIALGELGRWSGGMTPSMREPSYWVGGDFPWISSSDVKAPRLFDTAHHITAKAIRDATTTVLPASSIVLVNRSGILRRYLPIAILMRDMAINQDIKALVLKANLSAEFMLHALTYYGDEILATCLKSGTTVESIELSWLKAFEIRLPGFDEQVAIADFLSYMDAEIEAIEAKLGKARQIKQGMMQELLTGKTRLV